MTMTSCTNGKHDSCIHTHTYTQGVDTGISQVAKTPNSGDSTVVWNFPIDISFRSINAHGWPRLVLAVYGMDALGRDVVRGYGQTHIPAFPGQYTRYVRMFLPMSSSWFQEWTAWLMGNQVEFYDSRSIATSENRDVTRVKPSGVVKVTINVVTRGMKSHGFTDGSIEEYADSLAKKKMRLAAGAPVGTPLNRSLRGRGRLRSPASRRSAARRSRSRDRSRERSRERRSKSPVESPSRD